MVNKQMNKSQLKVLYITDDDAPLTHNCHSGNLMSIHDKVGEGVYTETELDYLVSLGLVSKIDVEGISKMLATLGFAKDVDNFIGRENIYYRTSLGNNLINFLKPVINYVL